MALIYNSLKFIRRYVIFVSSFCFVVLTIPALNNYFVFKSWYNNIFICFLFKALFAINTCFKIESIIIVLLWHVFFNLTQSYACFCSKMRIKGNPNSIWSIFFILWKRVHSDNNTLSSRRLSKTC